MLPYTLATAALRGGSNRACKRRRTVENHPRCPRVRSSSSSRRPPRNQWILTSKQAVADDAPRERERVCVRTAEARKLAARACSFAVGKCVWVNVVPLSLSCAWSALFCGRGMYSSKDGGWARCFVARPTCGIWGIWRNWWAAAIWTFVGVIFNWPRRIIVDYFARRTQL